MARADDWRQMHVSSANVASSAIPEPPLRLFAVVDTTHAERKELAMLKPVATVALVLASLMTTAGLAHAQSSLATTPGFELLVPSGTVVPTDAQEDDLKRAT
jgi:hypothetical protein